MSDRDGIPRDIFENLTLRAENTALLESIVDFFSNDVQADQHVPFEVACDYHDNAAYQAQYGIHVDACDFCQSLIDTMQPEVPRLPDMIEEADEPSGETEANWSDLLEPYTMPPQAYLYSQIPKLRVLEMQQTPQSRFQAAAIYLSGNQPELGWRRIGDGLAELGIPETLVYRISHACSLTTMTGADSFLMFEESMIQAVAPACWSYSNTAAPVNLMAHAGSAVHLASFPLLHSRPDYHMLVVTPEVLEGRLSYMESSARVGFHAKAVTSLYCFLEESDVPDEVVEIFKDGLQPLISLGSNRA